MSGELKGFAGNLLRVDLDHWEARVEPVSPELARLYLGGSGYGARLLYDEMPAGVDPLGPDNLMVLATGPLSMVSTPGGGSLTLCFKSPATGIWGESRVGSDFGPDLKRAGFDFVIIKGKSPEPVMLVIQDGKFEFHKASHLLGMTVPEKTEVIRKDFNEKKMSVMCIGPAGERLVNIAAVMSDDRAAGRCGPGAVWGSKNLIAVAVKGTNKVQPALPEKFREAMKMSFKDNKESPMFIGFKNFGTIGDIPANDDGGDWPTKNWQSNSWGKGPEVYDHYTKNNLIKGFGCYTGCPMACARWVSVKDGKYQTPEHGGAEYESISCFTAYVLNENMDAAVHSTYLCNIYGLDTISTGAMIAFAMDCYEHGLLPAELVGDLDLTWGNPDVLPQLVKMIAYREGLGDLLANGVRAASRKLGPEAEALAIHVKGLEGPAHDPRSGKALGITYATGNRGMCHIHPLEGMAWDRGKMDFGLAKFGVPDPNGVERWDEAGKGPVVKILQDGLALPDIIGTCKFYMYAGVTVDDWAALISALTGWEDFDGWELMKVSERSINLQRMFNNREGITAKDDCLPQRVRTVPAFAKYSTEPDCVIHDLDSLLQEYYQARGWDPQTGAPTQEKKVELGLA